MCDPISAVVALGAVAGVAQSASASSKANRLAKQQQAEQEALTATQQATRSASQQSAYNVSDEAGGSDTGLGNTFLTGAGGVNNGSLNLGGSSATNNNILGG